MRSLRGKRFSKSTLLMAIFLAFYTLPACAPSKTLNVKRADTPVNNASQKSADEPRRPPIEQLFEAIYKDDSATVQSLLQSGVSIEAHNWEGDTPLILAASKLKLEIARLLLARGADINASTTNNLTSLTAALQEYEVELSNHDSAINLQDARTLIFLLIDQGADVNRQIREGDSALIFAVEAKERDLVRLLLQKGARVNPKGEYLKTPLYEAVASQDLDTVKMLLDHKADPNVWEPGYSPYNTVLMVAVNFKNLPLVELLLKYGAKVNAEGRYGINALDIAIVNQDQPMIALLKQAGAKPGSTEMLKHLREQQTR